MSDRAVQRRGLEKGRFPYPHHYNKAQNYCTLLSLLLIMSSELCKLTHPHAVGGADNPFFLFPYHLCKIDTCATLLLMMNGRCHGTKSVAMEQRALPWNKETCKCCILCIINLGVESLK